MMPPTPSNAFSGVGGDVTRPYKYFLKYPKTCFISRKIANHIKKTQKLTLPLLRAIKQGKNNRNKFSGCITFHCV